MHAFMRRRLRALAPIVVASLLAACGGGGSGGARIDALRITGATVPSAAVGHPYSTSLAAAGGAPPYTWLVVPASGVPPTGIALSTGGGLAGTAVAEGDSFFTVQVRDATSSIVTARVALSARVLDATTEPQGDLGLLLPDTECFLTATAGADAVSFAIVSDPSGGDLVDADPALRRVTFRAGPTTGHVVVRATRSFGTTIDFSFDVVADPFARMTARFGSTDVWWCRFDMRDDPATPFTTDLDDALASVGLRDPTSYDALGTRADRLAKTYVIRQVFRRMNRAFLNDPDGDAAVAGLPASFSYLDPGDAMHAAPPVASRVLAFASGYNVISFHYGFEGGFPAGSYGFPDPGNLYLENFDGRNPQNAMGVHTQAAADLVNLTFLNPMLPPTPIDATDAAALEAMVLDAPLPGVRPDELRRIADDLANVLGVWAAHAIGHGFGLYHPTGNGAPTIMGGAWPQPVTEASMATAAFDGNEANVMSAALPGPGR